MRYPAFASHTVFGKNACRSTVLERDRSRQVEREVQKELDADKPEGEEALNNLFKQIYGKVGVVTALVFFLFCFFPVNCISTQQLVVLSSSCGNMYMALLDLG